ncbi:MAG: PQQ-binding-like beta-propeller repeat protein [Bacteroidota bacterium]
MKGHKYIKVITNGLFVCLLMLNTKIAAQKVSDLQIDFGTTPSATLPLDVALKHRFTVKNTGNAELVVDLRTRVVDTNQEAPTFPQPPTLYFAPQEEISVAVILDAAIGNLNQLPVGDNTRTVEYKFINRSNTNDTLKVSNTYQIKVLDKTKITGSFQIFGKVVDQNGAGIANAQLNLETGTDFSLPDGSRNDGTFQYNVPAHSKWMLKASKQGYSDAYAFIEPGNSGPYQLKLLPAPDVAVQFQQTKTVNVEFGFWQGAVSSDEQYVLLTQGMEIWQNESVRPLAKLFLYKVDGTKVWEYAMGYDSWGLSMSGDRAFVAYAQKHPTQPEIGLLDGMTGTPIWKKKLDLQNFPTGSIYIGHNSNEIRISNTKQFVSVGTGEGDFYLLRLSDGQLLWRKFLKGQVRNSQFSSDDQYVYVGSDPWLVKLRTSDGSEVWRSYISSWPLHYGLKISPDGNLIASMVKSGEVTVIRTSDGKKVWGYDQGVIGQWLDFSVDSKLLASAAFGGTWIFDALTGKPLWRSKGTKAGYFTDKYLLLFNEIYTLDGTRIYMLPDNNIGGQFAFMNKDASRVVLAAGQMYSPGIGISFFNGSIISSVEDNIEQLPSTFALSQNYPNPFNPETVISYQLSAFSKVSLKIYDILGREVATLVNEYQQPGIYNSQFSIRNYQLSSGVYFYTLKATPQSGGQAGDYIQTKKMIFLK